MTMYERIENLRKANGISQGKLEKELGFSNGSISKWKNSSPTPERLQKIADYFNVTVDFLLNGDKNNSTQVLTDRDERDIAKDLDRIMAKLTYGEDGPATYDGQELSPEASELFREELEIALKRLKIINKEKYTPKKCKK